MPQTGIEITVFFLGVAFISWMLLRFRWKDFEEKKTSFDDENKITPEKYGSALWIIRELEKIVQEDGGPQNAHEERVVEEAKLLLMLDHEKIKGK